MPSCEEHVSPNALTTAATCAGLMGPLLHYARSRLHNVALAEDAVSESILATLESGRSFASAAQQVAWVYGVLRHKLVDQLRQQQREAPAGDLVSDGMAVNPGDGQVLGAWPCSGGAAISPEQACDQKQLIDRVHDSCNAMPSLQRRAFLMREMFDMDAEVICRTLGVTDGHLWVLLHRARQRLRKALHDLAPAPRRPTRQARPRRGDGSLRHDRRNAEPEPAAAATMSDRAIGAAVLPQMLLCDQPTSTAAATAGALLRAQRRRPLVEIAP
jgi:RNA polymerase sigma factor (sigma-70 family)